MSRLFAETVAREYCLARRTISLLPQNGGGANFIEVKERFIVGQIYFNIGGLRRGLDVNEMRWNLLLTFLSRTIGLAPIAS